MIVSVIGCGYLGAVHATSMAHLGHEVRAYDIDSSRIAKLSRGVVPFYEPGFEELLKSTLQGGRLSFTDSAENAIRGAELHFICVGTPQQRNTEAADLSYLQSAFEIVLKYADGPGTIVGKSTVPVGTAQRLASFISSSAGVYSLDVAWCPEFLREGSAIKDTLSPDRLIFGVSNSSSETALLNVFKPIVESGIPYITTDLQTAEMVKVAANSFLATKISFINAMSEICDAAHADVVTLSQALGYDSRIGSEFLDAGLGFGGGCLPKDLRALRVRADELGVNQASNLLQAVNSINLHQRERVVDQAVAVLGSEISTKKVAILGASFKPNSDDVRDSPALEVASTLHRKGATVTVHDPHAIVNSRKLFPALNYSDSVEGACAEANLVIHATSWPEYRQLEPTVLASIVCQPTLIDARNSLDLELWLTSGWRVFSLGRGRN